MEATAFESGSDYGLEAFFDTGSFETISGSSVAYITKAHFRNHSELSSGPVAIKSASVRREYSKQPHDIVKELRLLRKLSDVNIIQVLGHTFERAMSSIHFWMPFIPHVLSDILFCPRFSPHALPGHPSVPSQAAAFTVAAKSLIYQITSGLLYLHNNHIAHRDIKPRNILFTQQGCIKLIDFGIAWTDVRDPSVVQDDLWPEPPGKMCFDVSTGPYRPPELLFGATAYDAFAADVWSLGTTCAEFFTQLRLEREYDDFEDDHRCDSGEEEGGPQPIVIPSALAESPDTIWTRRSLFDSTRGSIGLAWSIFKVRGTPTEKSWPTFKDLPDADKVTFHDVPAVALEPLLPNLPTNDIRPEDGGASVDNSSVTNSVCLDFIDRLLVYPPAMRLRPERALHHPWFTNDLPLLLPEEYPSDSGHTNTVKWDEKTLADLLSTFVSSSVD